MSWKNRVAWSQGMFLQPQHFQQEARAVERALDAARTAAAPFAWGFSHLVLDDAALALGRVGISEASGVLPDGTPFSIPLQDQPPLPLELAADASGAGLVYLAAPLARLGATEFDFGAATDPALARFRVDAVEVRDQTNSAADPVAIQVGELNLRLIPARDATDAYAVLGVCRVAERRNDLQVILDRDYIPPQFSIGATSHLSGFASWVNGLLMQRADAMAARMGQLSHGVAELADFLRLQTINRYAPLLAQYAELKRHHPQQFFELLLQLVGDLSTLMSTTRRPRAFAAYRHDDLTATFAPLMLELRRLLSIELEQNVVPIELTLRSHGVRTASVAETDLLRTASFVLAINATVPGEQLRARFLAQAKIGPVQKIRDLVHLQLPGIQPRPLPVAPRQLPFFTGAHYFELERGTELWKLFEADGNLAIHMPGEVPGLEMHLWAIRQ